MAKQLARGNPQRRKAGMVDRTIGVCQECQLTKSGQRQVDTESRSSGRRPLPFALGQPKRADVPAVVPVINRPSSESARADRGADRLAEMLKARSSPQTSRRMSASQDERTARGAKNVL
ncbi:hypothetical protein CBL_20793 [Carabus blaptoides fortunei]